MKVKYFAYDNSVAERYFWSLKQEWTRHVANANLEEAGLSVFKYIEVYCNRQRLHQSLGDTPPRSIRSRMRPRHQRRNKITYEFAAIGERPAVKVYWYDGGKLPPKPTDMDPDVKLSDNGIYFSGEFGTMVCGGWSGEPTLYPQRRRDEFQVPEKSIPRSIGHRAEWIQACKDEQPENAKAGFAYSGPFTESLLVGNLAVLLQQRIEWNSEEMVATGVPNAEPLIRKDYRKGFGIT